MVFGLFDLFRLFGDPDIMHRSSAVGVEAAWDGRNLSADPPPVPVQNPTGGFDLYNTAENVAFYAFQRGFYGQKQVADRSEIVDAFEGVDYWTAPKGDQSVISGERFGHIGSSGLYRKFDFDPVARFPRPLQQGVSPVDRSLDALSVDPYRVAFGPFRNPDEHFEHTLFVRINLCGDFPLPWVFSLLGYGDSFPERNVRLAVDEQVEVYARCFE